MPEVVRMRYYDPMVTPTSSAHAIGQHATTTGNLSARIALHAYGTNPQDCSPGQPSDSPCPAGSWKSARAPGKAVEPRQPVSRGLSLTLTDFSPATYEQLRAVTAADVRHCDAVDLPFGDADFDTVIANHMLYHLDDPDVALREFARVPCVGGRVAIAVNGAGHLAELDAFGPAIGRSELGTGRRSERLHGRDRARARGPPLLRCRCRTLPV